MEFGIISLFPEMFKALEFGIPGKAIKQQRISVQYWNPRDFTKDKHRTVDDKPYGGGPGMVMMVQPLSDAIQAAKEALGQQAKVIYLSPQGEPFKQAYAESLSKQDKMIFVCGRYEGIDERIIDTLVDEEWSIGDYVLTGGELAAMVMIDSITRLIPGVLGDEQSAEQDSFAHGLLDYPHYTRPESLQGLDVPKVLLSGDHQAIAKWRQRQALKRTLIRRPELLESVQLAPEQQRLLQQLCNEQVSDNPKE